MPRKACLIVVVVFAALAFAVPASADVGLSGWWRLDEGSGTIAHDASGNGNQGTIQGTPSWVSGYFGSALAFDGATNRIEVPDRSSLEPASGLTVTAWVKASGDPGQFRYIVAKGASSCIAASYGLYTGPSDGLVFYVSQNVGLTYALSPDAGMRVWDGKWHFVVGTYDGSSVRLYVDGSEVASGTPFSGPIGYGLTGGNDLFIGHYDGCAAHDFAGSIDEPTVWSRVLTAPQISFANLVMVTLHRLLGRLPSFPAS